MKSKSKIITGGVLCALFVIYIILLKTVNVAPAGDSMTPVGFSGLNQAFFNAFHGNNALYEMTEALGIGAILTALLFAAVGGIQLIKRRSLAKVDKEIFALGGLYVVLGVLYVLFEVVVVNCRPVIMPGSTEVEASFPSSHTMLICVIMGSTFMVLRKYIKDGGLRKVLQAACVAAIVMTVLGRLFCGVHWLTDIIGGVLISTALLFVFAGVLGMISEKTEDKS